MGRCPRIQSVHFGEPSVDCGSFHESTGIFQSHRTGAGFWLGNVVGESSRGNAGNSSPPSPERVNRASSLEATPAANTAPTFVVGDGKVNTDFCGNNYDCNIIMQSDRALKVASSYMNIPISPSLATCPTAVWITVSAPAENLSCTVTLDDHKTVTARLAIRGWRY